MAQSKIEWTTWTCNPAPGCMHVAAGCEHCYAEKFAARLANMGQKKYQAVVRKGPMGKYLPQWNGQIYLDMAAIEALRKIKKPKMVFLQSMGDIFYEKIADSDIRKILAIAAECHWHTFQILTKRPQRAYDILHRFYGTSDGVKWPFDNVWLGVSCSTPDDLWMLDMLLAIPAAVHFVSLEPLLNAIRISQHALRSLDWVIVGGESGKGARPMHPQWVRDIRDQCVAAGVPFFFKQWGEWAPFIDDINHHYSGSTWGNVAYNRAIRRCAKAHGASILLDDRPEGWSNIMLRNGCCVNKGLMIGRVGKKKAGRILDGRTWDEMPDGMNK